MKRELGLTRDKIICCLSRILITLINENAYLVKTMHIDTVISEILYLYHFIAIRAEKLKALSNLALFLHLPPRWKASSHFYPGYS